MIGHDTHCESGMGYPDERCTCEKKPYVNVTLNDNECRSVGCPCNPFRKFKNQHAKDCYVPNVENLIERYING